MEQDKEMQPDGMTKEQMIKQAEEETEIYRHWEDTHDTEINPLRNMEAESGLHNPILMNNNNMKEPNKKSSDRKMSDAVCLNSFLNENYMSGVKKQSNFAPGKCSTNSCTLLNLTLASFGHFK